LCIFLLTARTRLTSYLQILRALEVDHLTFNFKCLISELNPLTYTRTWYFPFFWLSLDLAYFSSYVKEVDNSEATKLDTSWFMVHRGFKKQPRNSSIRLNRTTPRHQRFHHLSSSSILDFHHKLILSINTFISLHSWKSIAYMIQII